MTYIIPTLLHLIISRISWNSCLTLYLCEGASLYINSYVCFSYNRKESTWVGKRKLGLNKKLKVYHQVTKNNSKHY